MSSCLLKNILLCIVGFVTYIQIVCMDPEQIKKTLWALEEISRRMSQSKEYALTYLEESGILKMLEDGGLLSTPVKSKKKK